MNANGFSIDFTIANRIESRKIMLKIRIESLFVYSNKCNFLSNIVFLFMCVGLRADFRIINEIATMFSW